jgi:hypothetical protein
MKKTLVDEPTVAEIKELGEKLEVVRPRLRKTLATRYAPRANIKLTPEELDSLEQTTFRSVYALWKKRGKEFRSLEAIVFWMAIRKLFERVRNEGRRLPSRPGRPDRRSIKAPSDKNPEKPAKVVPDAKRVQRLRRVSDFALETVSETSESLDIEAIEYVDYLLRLLNPEDEHLVVEWLKANGDWDEILLHVPKVSRGAYQRRFSRCLAKIRELEVAR